MILYKKAVCRVIVKPKGYFVKHNCYFHRLRKVVLVTLVVPPKTWVCENSVTSEIRVEKCGATCVEEAAWTEEEKKQMDEIRKDAEIEFVVTGYLDLGIRYYVTDNDNDISCFKPFTMKPTLSGIANGIYAFRKKEVALKYDMFEEAEAYLASFKKEK